MKNFKTKKKSLYHLRNFNSLLLFNLPPPPPGAFLLLVVVRHFSHFLCLSWFLSVWKYPHSAIILQLTTPENTITYHDCPCRDFAQKAKSRGGTPVTRAYIKESTYSWNIQSVYSKIACVASVSNRVIARKLERPSFLDEPREERLLRRLTRKNLDLLEQGPRGIGRMMTFLLFAPASTKWLGWRKNRKSRRDRLGRFCDIYCAVILRYSFALRVISDILWSSCFERHSLSADEVKRCV